MKRVFLVILLLFTSFASIHAERIATLDGMGEGGRPYIIESMPDGSIRGRTQEPLNLTKAILTGLGIVLLSIFCSSR